MADPRPLPELSEGLLDAATLEQLFADLGAFAEGVEVRLKGAARQRADAATTTLEQAREVLLSGRACSAQIRYWWGGRAWIDTLMREPDGVRICRMAIPG